MLVDTNLVSAADFRRHLDKYLLSAREGCGPIAVTKSSEVVGFFISAVEFQSMMGAAVQQLRSSRETGRTVTHEEATGQIRQVARPKSKLA